MESESKRLRKREFSGPHLLSRVKVKELTVFLTPPPPPFSPFPTEITRQFLQAAHAGPWTLQPGLAYTKILAAIVFSELDEKC